MSPEESPSQDPAEPKPFLLLNRQRKLRIDRRGLEFFLEALIEEISPLGFFSVVMVSDRVLRRHNANYRGDDRTTDVLSFPGDEDYLGDILISTETAYKQVRKSQTLDFEANLKRLALHGVLHLMGYDHETDDGAMRTLERRLRRRFRC